MKKILIILLLLMSVNAASAYIKTINTTVIIHPCSNNAVAGECETVYQDGALKYDGQVQPGAVAGTFTQTVNIPDPTPSNNISGSATVTNTPIHNATATNTPIPNITTSPSATSTPKPTVTPSEIISPTPNSTVTTIPNPGQRPTVILTFDDGWLTVYTKAYPILRANNQSGVVFVNVEPILGGWSDFVPKADLDIMYNSGWDISSHTYSHVDLTTLNDSTLKHELNDSKNWLDANGYPKGSMFLSYPYGGYNNAVTTALKNYGYAAARTIDTTTNYTHYNLNSPDIYMMKNYEAIGGIDNDVTIINQIHDAIAVNGLLILSFHKIVDTLSPDADNASTEFKVSDFHNVSNYLKSSGVDVRTLSDYLGTTPKITPIVSVTITPNITATPAVNVAVISNSTVTPVATSSSPAALSKYNQPEKGGSSGGNYVIYVPLRPTSTPIVNNTPIPAETVDFNSRVVTESTTGIRYVPENIEVPQVEDKGIFERIKEFFINLWKMIL